MSTFGTCAEKSTSRSRSSSSIPYAGWGIVYARRNLSDTLHRNEPSFTRVSVGSVVHAALERDIRPRRNRDILRPGALLAIEFARVREPSLDTGRADTHPGTGRC